MLRSSFLLLLFSAGVSVFLTGAWSATFAPTADVAERRFVPQAIPLDPDVVGNEVTPARLLDLAIAKLARASWLKTRIKQTVANSHSSFTAKGVLHLGPHHCVRFDMQLPDARLLFVSDGTVLAQERTLGNDAPNVVCEHLPGDDKSAYLARKGCGGPLAILRELQASMTNLKLQTGLLDGRPVILIKGDMASPPRQGAIFLDAATLWPHRAEWSTTDGSQHTRMEFTDGEFDRELPIAECERLFSYHPGPI